MGISKSYLRLFTSNGIGTGIQFLATVYFARVLGPAEIGSFFLFQAVVGILAIPSDFGLRAALEKRISELGDEAAFLSTTLALKVVPITAIGLGILNFSKELDNYLGIPTSPLLIIALITQEISETFIFVLRGELRVDETAIIQLVRRISWVCISLLLLSIGMDVTSLVWGFILSQFISGLIGWTKIDISFGSPSIGHAESLIQYGRYSVVSSIGGYLYNWVDILVLGALTTQAVVGAYEIAWRLTSISLLLSRAVGSSIFPDISRSQGNNDYGRIETTITKNILPSIFLTIPSFIGILILSSDILRVIFGEEYIFVSFVAIILMFDKVFQSAQIVISKSLQAVGGVKFAAKATIISTIINLIGNIILVYYLGVIGAAIATVVASIVNDYLHYRYLSEFVSLTIPVEGILEIAVASMLMGVVVSILNQYLIVSDAISLVAIVIIGCLTYLLACGVLPHTRNMMIDWQNHVR